MEAITREEKLLSGQQLEPITRKELFLAKAAGMDVQTPEPITREEIFLSQISGGGGSAPAVIEPLSVTANGTYNPPDGVDGYSPVTVSVAREDQTDIEEQFIRAIERDSSKPVTELPAGLTKIGDNAFYGCNNLALTSLPEGVTSIGSEAFQNCNNLALTSLPEGVTSIGRYAFYRCGKCQVTSLPRELKSLYDYSIGFSQITELTFNGTPTLVQPAAFQYCNNLRTINVPWAEGEVSGAPWGATNATINYNYTGG